MIGLVYVFQTDDVELPVLLFVGFCILLLALTVFMWLFPFAVSKGISPYAADSHEQRNWTSNEVYGVGFVLLGTLLLFFALSDAIYWAFYLVWINSQAAGTREVDLTQKGAIVATVIELVFAIGLIVGSNGLAKMIRRLRYGGLD